MILLAAAGLLSMLAQVVILRELVAALFGVELLYVVALGAWLGGTALGSVTGRCAPDHPGVIAAAFAAAGALTLGELALIRTAGVMIGAVPGAYLPFPIQIIGILAATLPTSFLFGFVFPPLVRRAAAGGRPVSLAYAWECAGAATGGVAVTAMFWAGLSTMQAAILTLAAAGVAAVLTAVRSIGARVACTVLIACAAAFGTSAKAGAWNESLLRWQYPALAAVEDTPYARVVVTRAGSQLAVFANGAFAFDTESTSAEAFADLAALQHRRPLRALVIGGGAEGVPAALAAHGLNTIDNVEVDQRADALVGHMTGQAPASLRSEPPVRVIYDEPRRVLDREPAYDLILVAMPPPTSGETSRYYTQEFFAICRTHLAASGVVAIRLPAAENFWPPPLVRLVGSVVGAMAQEFPSVSVVPGGTLYAFGGVQPLPQAAEPLVSRLAVRGLKPRLMTPPYLRYLYGNDRRTEVREWLRTLPPSDVNRDAAPVAYGHAAMLWLSKFYPRAGAGGAAAAVPGTRAAVAAVLALVVAGLWWASRTRARASLAVMLVVSAATMALETAALLRYQVANGVMFVNVGLLLTCVMAGMAVGSWAGGTPAVHRRLTTRPWLIAASVLVVAVGVIMMTRWPALAGIAGAGVLLALAGGVAGATFAALTDQRPGDVSRAVGALYAADVAGGAIGAWVAPIVLVPVCGLDGTAAAAAGAALALVPLLLGMRSYSLRPPMTTRRPS